jgi:hypothetical protein
MVLGQSVATILIRSIIGRTLTAARSVRSALLVNGSVCRLLEEGLQKEHGYDS